MHVYPLSTSIRLNEGELGAQESKMGDSEEDISPGSCVRTAGSGCLVSPEDDPALSSTADSETS